jgi:hypothetical protein
MFDRTEHCRRIGAHGGAITASRYGSHHMAAIGKAGAQATIRAHGVAYFQGLMVHRGWQGHRPTSLGADLAAGRALAALAAALVLAVITGNGSAGAQMAKPDPSLAPLMASQAAKYPAPAGCAVVGVWEDGSIVAYCDAGLRDGLDEADTWLAHGPDADDDWQDYSGPRLAVWLRRAALR